MDEIGARNPAESIQDEFAPAPRKRLKVLAGLFILLASSFAVPELSPAPGEEPVAECSGHVHDASDWTSDGFLLAVAFVRLLPVPMAIWALLLAARSRHTRGTRPIKGVVFGVLATITGELNALLFGARALLLDAAWSSHWLKTIPAERHTMPWLGSLESKVFFDVGVAAFYCVISLGVIAIAGSCLVFYDRQRDREKAARAG